MLSMGLVLMPTWPTWRCCAKERGGEESADDEGRCSSATGAKLECCRPSKYRMQGCDGVELIISQCWRPGELATARRGGCAATTRNLDVLDFLEILDFLEFLDFVKFYEYPPFSDPFFRGKFRFEEFSNSYKSFV